MVGTAMDAAITRHRDSSEPKWDEMKSEIGWLYLVNNCTTTEIQDKLLAKYGFYATARQYKTRLKRWGFDQKKIQCWLWNALNLVMQDRGRRCKFHVPIRDGHSYKDITPEEVTKQWKRAQRSVKWRNYAEMHPDCNDLNAAYHMLSTNAVVIEDLDPASLSNKPQYVPQPQPTGPDIYEAVEPDLTVSDDSSSHSSASPTLSPTGLPSGNMTAAYFTSQRPRFIGKTGYPSTDEKERQWDRLPSVRNLIKDIEHNTTLPRVDVPIRGMEHATSVRIMESSSDQTTMSTTDPHDYEDLTQSFASFAIDSKHNAAQRDGWQKFLGMPIADPPHSPQNKEHFYAVEWAAYYVQQCLAGFERLDDYNHPDRLDAMANFQHMVKQCNRWIFPYVNWLVAVLGANDKPEQLQECLEDCCTTIDVTPTDHAWMYSVVLHFLLATHNKDSHEIRRFGSQLDDVLRYVCSNWGERNVSHLVIRNHHAYYLLDQGEAEAAQRSLLQSLPLYHQILGPSHVVTINCLGLLSRACDKLGQVDVAINYLQMALEQLRSPPRPLQAFYHNLLRRLAGLQIRTGRVQDAEYGLKKVLDFRLDAFGISARVTWNVIRSMVDLMLSQGRQDDADRLNREMEELFHQEQAYNYKNFHGHSPPWMRTGAAVDE